MISITELILKFGPSHNVDPWGLCLIIQGSEFDPDWEVYLADQGFDCFFDKLDGYPVTFVQLKKPIKKSGYRLQGAVWSFEDEQFLLAEYDRLVAEGVKAEFVNLLVKLPQFKSRSLAAVTKKLYKLLRKRREISLVSESGSQIQSNVAPERRTDKALEQAKKIIAKGPELLKEAYGNPQNGELFVKSGLYFSFGDIMHFIHSSLRLSISIREMKGGAGIAYFEDLIARLRLYLIAELKLVVEMKPPYGRQARFNEVEPDYNFINDFLELFKELDQTEVRLKEIRKNEGGFYQ